MLFTVFYEMHKLKKEILWLNKSISFLSVAKWNRIFKEKIKISSRTSRLSQGIICRVGGSITA